VNAATLAVHLRDLAPAEEESLWLEAAVATVQEHSLLATPLTRVPGAGEPDLYESIEALARRMAGPTIREAEAQLQACDVQVTRTGPRPAEPPPVPTDVAVALYTPQLDAAYFLGLVMGVRLARALDGTARCVPQVGVSSAESRRVSDRS
jgi:hypothetical protein